MPTPTPARRLRRYAVSAAIAVAGCALAPYGAQANPYYKLKRINNDVNAARRGFLKTVGRNIDSERRALARTAERLAAAQRKLTADLKVEGAAYRSVYDNLTSAQAELHVQRLAVAAAAAVVDVSTTHRRGEPVAAATFRQLDETVSRFVRGTNEHWSNAAKFYQKRARELRTANPKVIAAKAARAEAAKRRAAAAAKRAAAQAQKQRRAVVARARHDIVGAIARTGETSAAQLNTLQTAITSIRDEAPRAARYFAAELKRFRAHAQWSKSDAELAPALATLLSGELIAHGRSRGKSLTVNIRAKADHCYALLTRYANWSGSERIHSFKWVQKTREPVQRFEVWQPQKYRIPPIRGFCVTAAGRVTATAKLQFAGTKNGVRYVVVGWTRKTFPTALAGKLRLLTDDHCDFTYWQKLWTNPVPGTLVYHRAEPRLIVSPGYFSYGGGSKGYVPIRTLRLDMTTMNVGTGASLTDQPPRAVAVRTQFRYRKCPRQYGTAPLSKKIHRCYQSIDRKYASQWRAIDRLRDAARRQGGISPYAERRADKLGERQEREQQRRCRPLETTAKKRQQAVFNKLVDHLVDNRPQNGLRRAEYLQEILK